LRRYGAAELEIALDAHARIGEGPAWDEGNGELLWVTAIAEIPHPRSSKFPGC
jgi:sugar lactone lactonase YvrE